MKAIRYTPRVDNGASDEEVAKEFFDDLIDIEVAETVEDAIVLGIENFKPTEEDPEPVTVNIVKITVEYV